MLMQPPVLLLYDSLITFPREVRQVWSRGPSWFAVLYLTNRYCAILHRIMTSLQHLHGQTFAVCIHICQLAFMSKSSLSFTTEVYCIRRRVDLLSLILILIRLRQLQSYSHNCRNLGRLHLACDRWCVLVSAYSECTDTEMPVSLAFSALRMYALTGKRWWSFVFPMLLSSALPVIDVVRHRLMEALHAEAGLTYVLQYASLPFTPNLRSPFVACDLNSQLTLSAYRM